MDNWGDEQENRNLSNRPLFPKKNKLQAFYSKKQ